MTPNEARYEYLKVIFPNPTNGKRQIIKNDNANNAILFSLEVKFFEIKRTIK